MYNVTAAVNISFKEALPKSVLIQSLLEGNCDQKWQSHFDVFFTEIAAHDIIAFANANAIPLKSVRDFYQTHIKPEMTNKELEEAFQL